MLVRVNLVINKIIFFHASTWYRERKGNVIVEIRNRSNLHAVSCLMLRVVGFKGGFEGFAGILYRFPGQIKSDYV